MTYITKKTDPENNTKNTTHIDTINFGEKEGKVLFILLQNKTQRVTLPTKSTILSHSPEETHKKTKREPLEKGPKTNLILNPPMGFEPWTITNMDDQTPKKIHDTAKGGVLSFSHPFFFFFFCFVLFCFVSLFLTRTNHVCR